LISVDSSVWIAYFQGLDLPATQRLETAMQDREETVVWPAVVTEVLAGFRSDRLFEEARRILDLAPRIPHRPEIYVHAAQLFRHLRKVGITAGTTDCLIAQSCIENNTPLLTLDRDFTLIARHSALKLQTN
jgi:predicted nucleic acid-binding protein